MTKVNHWLSFSMECNCNEFRGRKGSWPSKMQMGARRMSLWRVVCSQMRRVPDQKDHQNVNSMQQGQQCLGHERQTIGLFHN